MFVKMLVTLLQWIAWFPVMGLLIVYVQFTDHPLRSTVISVLIFMVIGIIIGKSI